jgi:hypothetical protein
MARAGRSRSIPAYVRRINLGHVLGLPDDEVAWLQNFAGSHASKPACGVAFVLMASASCFSGR